jgi:hypothetical protein
MKLPLTARELRWLAEAADGKRDVSITLAQDADGTVAIVDEKAPPQGWKPLLTMRTTYDPAEQGMRTPVRIHLVRDRQEIELGADVDAIFLTQSAIEKFVFPYYARHWTLDEIAALRTSLFAPEEVVAAQHIPPSITESIESGARCGRSSSSGT